jgi:hypothetical protein
VGREEGRLGAGKREDWRQGRGKIEAGREIGTRKLGAGGRI